MMVWRCHLPQQICVQCSTHGLVPPMAGTTQITHCVRFIHSSRSGSRRRKCSARGFLESSSTHSGGPQHEVPLSGCRMELVRAWPGAVCGGHRQVLPGTLGAAAERLECRRPCRQPGGHNAKGSVTRCDCSHGYQLDPANSAQMSEAT